MNLFTSNMPNIQQQIKDLIDSTNNLNEKIKVLFQLSQCIGEQQEKNGLAHLDSRIYSENIINSLSNEVTNFFRPIDYQYNFLIFLINNYSAEKELNEYINEFIDKFKKEFTAKDIEITATGATRCKTNIRFAVKALRELGLLDKKDRYGNRSLRPSLMGLLLIYYIHNQELHNGIPIEQKLYKTPNSLKVIKSDKNTKLDRYKPSVLFDPNLIEGIKKLKDVGKQYNLLNYIQQKIPKGTFTDDTRKSFEKLFNEYTNYILENIEYNEEGLIVKSKIGNKALKMINEYEKLEESDRFYFKLLALLKI